MTTIGIFGATGYAGTAITEEAVSRGHTVIAVSRTAREGTSRAGVEIRLGDIQDAKFVDAIAAASDVLIVAVRAVGNGGETLLDAVPSLIRATGAHGTRLGFVGGAGSLLVAEGGPRLIDTPAFPEVALAEASSHAEVLDAIREAPENVDWFYVSPAAEFGDYNPGEATGHYRVGGDLLLSNDEGRSQISGADFALAVVDEIEQPRHHRTRLTFAY